MLDGKHVKEGWVKETEVQAPANPPAKEPEIEVIGVDRIHNVDSQPDYTPSAPPEEMVTGLYPSLDGLEEELNREDAPDAYDGTINVADEEDPFEKEPPVSVCVSCLLPGHQGGQECTFLKDECKYCGREHSTRLKCRVVEIALKYGGNAMNIVPEKKTWETPMENLCPDCLEIRHHSSLICKEKEPVLATLNVIPEEESP